MGRDHPQATGGPRQLWLVSPLFSTALFCFQLLLCSRACARCAAAAGRAPRAAAACREILHLPWPCRVYEGTWREIGVAVKVLMHRGE